METGIRWLLAAIGCALLLTSCRESRIVSATVPVALDHNRMLVDAEFQRLDGSWRQVRLWIDTGSPDFFLSEALARDLGIDLSAMEKTAEGTGPPLAVPPPSRVRIGDMALDFAGVKNSVVIFEPSWLFNTMHIDGNLPATVLNQYHVVFDYPERQLTIAEPGILRPRGKRAAASVHPETGIVQIDAVIDGENLSFALDNGASYSFVPAEVVARFSQRHPEWPQSAGALGCANIWGWWPEEPEWPIIRLPEIQWGSVHLADVALVGLPMYFPSEAGMGDWYSLKTARPVAGLLGPNAFKAFRVEIDYANSAVYFEKGPDLESRDTDLVGLTLRPEADGSYQVIGVASKDGKPAVVGIEPGDTLVQVGDVKATGATMGTVIDALRGRPGDVHTLVLERHGERFLVEARVDRFLPRSQPASSIEGRGLPARLEVGE